MRPSPTIYIIHKQTVEAHRLVRRRGSYIFLDNRLTDGGEVYLLQEKTETQFLTLKFPWQFSLVLLVKIGWR
jgi:hypothetical protein